MKYLIKNRKEFAISVGFFVMTAVNLIRALMAKEIDEGLIVAVVYAFFGVLAWFYNMSTSEENCKHTGEMRLEKKMKKILKDEEQFIGENFFDDIKEEDQEEE